MKTMNTFSKMVLPILLWGGIFSVAIAQPNISYNQIYSGFNLLVDIANCGDGSDRLFVVEKQGVIKVIKNGVTLPTAFLDINPKVINSGNERGLLGLVFHPDYSNNGYFFVNYINNSGNTVIARYSVSGGNADVADFNSEDILLTITQPYANHNAGDLNFSPEDGFLYIGMGDGGSAFDPDCYAQDSTSLLGKMLRIDVDQNVNTPPYYGIPTDNPFLSLPNVPDEIWALGLRNPWRFSFDELNGDMWIADVGQDQREEVNYQPVTSEGGENYGWKIHEGDLCFDPDPIDVDCSATTPSCGSPVYTDPLFVYDHGVNGGFSITGGVVFRSCPASELYGYYIFGDYVLPNGWIINSSGTVYSTIDLPAELSTFGLTESGSVLMGTLGGDIYLIEDEAYPSVVTIDGTDSPLSSSYFAKDSITLSGSISISNNSSVTLTAPKVVNNASIDVPTTSSLLVVESGCGGN